VKVLIRTTLSGMAALIVGMSISRFAYTPILPQMLQQHAVSHAQGALLASVNLLGYLIGAVPAALPALRDRPALTLRIALAVNVLMLAAMLVPHNYGLWLFARLLSGISSAFIFVFASTIVLALRKPPAVTALFSSVGIGIAVSGLLVPYGYSLRPAWQTGWIICTLLGALLAAFAIVNVAGEHASAEITTNASRSTPRTNAAFWFVAVAYGCAGFSYVVPATFLVTILSGDPALAPFASASWVAVGIVAALSILAWTPLGNRYGKSPMLVAALLLLAIGCIAPAIAHNAIGALTAAFGLGASFMGISMLCLAIVRDLDPARSSTRIAQATAIFSVGQVLGPLFTAYSYEHTKGYVEALVVASLVLVAAAIVAALSVIFSPYRRVSPNPECRPGSPAR
jgi:predicted MFS family arabinose efflux permease